MHLWSYLVAVTILVAGSGGFCLGYTVCYLLGRRSATPPWLPKPAPTSEEADQALEAAQGWWPKGFTTMRRGEAVAPAKPVHVRSHWRRARA